MPTGLGGEQLWISATNDNTGTSTAYDDQSGQGNNGTNNGSTVVSDTSNGGTYAFDFDGTNDYIDCGNILDAPTNFSISLWLQTPVSQSNVGVAGRWTNNPSFSGYMMWISTSGKYSVPIGGSPHLQTAIAVSTSSWVHDVVMYDSVAGESRIYVNGVLSASQFESGPTSSNENWTLGRYQGGVYEYFGGKLDDIRAYTRALTQAEITHLASARGVEGPAPVGLGDEELWLCPSLNDSANDISGNGNNGTYIGGLSTVADTSNGGSRAYKVGFNTQYVDLGNILDAPAEFSISIWFNRIANSDASGIIGKWSSSSGYMIYNSLLPTSVINGSPYVNGTSLSANTWRHLCITYDGTTNRLYEDGVLVASLVEGPPTSNSETFKIGAYGTSGNRGLYDDARAYTRALTQAEITHLATSRGITGSPGGATHYNPFKTHAFTNDFQQRLR